MSQGDKKKPEEPCDLCHGEGEIESRPSDPYDYSTRTCPSCKGTKKKTAVKMVLTASEFVNWPIDKEWLADKDVQILVNNDEKSPLYGWGALPPAKAKEYAALIDGVQKGHVKSNATKTHETMKTECTFAKGTMPDWVVEAFRISYEYCLKEQKRAKKED